MWQVCLFCQLLPFFIPLLTLLSGAAIVRDITSLLILTLSRENLTHCNIISLIQDQGRDSAAVQAAVLMFHSTAIVWPMSFIPLYIVSLELPAGSTNPFSDMSLLDKPFPRAPSRLTGLLLLSVPVSSYSTISNISGQ